jgi:hypothetical protein
VGATVIGVRHHSPACARLVARTIEDLRPAYVLVEGPADMNGRFDELLLGHQLPIAVFSSYRDEQRRHASWAPFCAYSPEWLALTTGRAVGAQLRFIDLPAWDPAFAERRNRYADAEQRYADVVDALCRSFGVDNVDTLWDHLVEIAPDDGLAERLAAYFDLLRGDTVAGDDDERREAYMARWVTAAVAEAGDRPVVVVTGGFHRAALISRVTAATDGPAEWPATPQLPAHAVGGSHLVPYSFRRLDAFDGYQSGMPSPEYYQQLWEHGAEAAAQRLTEAVVQRLRARRQPASTADLIAARAAAGGLALVRGHAHPSRTDVLNGLATALVAEVLDVALPWSARGALQPGSHPVVVEMVAALSGSRVGRLHPDTPAPPLLHSAGAELERHGLDRDGEVRLDLIRAGDRDRSRVLHQLRVLDVPGFVRTSGPSTGVDPVLAETWTVRRDESRLSALIEAGAYGATLPDAAAAALAERVAGIGGDVDRLAGVLLDAALCGVAEVSGRVLDDIARAVTSVGDLGALGRMLATVLTVWRHDRVFGTARSSTLGAVIAAAVGRVLWLAEGVHAGAVPADLRRVAALAACRDAVLHAGPALALDRAAALDTMGRIAADPAAPPDMRGAALGFRWTLGAGGTDPVRAVRGAFVPASAGDWLAGLFALAREQVLLAGGVLDVLDELVSAMGERDFLLALPAVRQAFAFFPPSERDTIAGRVLARRGAGGSSRALLRMPATAEVVAAGLDLDARVDAALRTEGLIG